MIYIAKPNVKENDFIALLEKSKKLILVFAASKKSISPLYFETIVFEQTCEAAKNTIFEGKVKQTGAHDFPDIIANKFFGIEVKMTTSNHWTSTGNSILESSRIEDVERIYIMFGKLGGKFDIRYRLYQECLPEISVTHSPRYRINMDLPLGKSIFDKIGIDYDTLRKDTNSIQIIKNYYRSQLKDGEGLWWIDQDSDDKSVSPIIKPFRRLANEEKENFIVEAMILFPEIFGKGNTKFERAATYLISEYNAVSASLRDSFSAGGKVKLKVKRKTITVPQLALGLYSKAKLINQKLKTMDAETLAFYWKSKKLDRNRLKQWKKLLNEKFAIGIPNILASDIFEAGLYEKN